MAVPERPNDVPLDESELVDLHECIRSADVRGQDCSMDDCEHDALVLVSMPRHAMTRPLCASHLPGHVEWYELAPAEHRASTVAHEVAATLDGVVSP